MLILDFRAIGNKLLALRKRAGLTQAELAERAGLADRTYADIERGAANMRLDTLQRICGVLRITPDEILTEEPPSAAARAEELMEQLRRCTLREQETALDLVEVYLRSLKA